MCERCDAITSSSSAKISPMSCSCFYEITCRSSSFLAVQFSICSIFKLIGLAFLKQQHNKLTPILFQTIHFPNLTHLIHSLIVKRSYQEIVVLIIAIMIANFVVVVTIVFIITDKYS